MNAADRPTDERFADWVDDRMSERERERFVAELRVSPQLRAELAAYERTVAALRQALQAPTRPVAMADRVRAAIASGSQAAAAAPPPSRRLYWSLLSAAALLALAFLLDAWPAGEGQPNAADMAKVSSPAEPVAPTAPDSAASDQAVGQLDRQVDSPLQQSEVVAQNQLDAAKTAARRDVAAEAQAAAPAGGGGAGDPATGSDDFYLGAGNRAVAAPPAAAAPPKSPTQLVPFVELQLAVVDGEPAPTPGAEPAQGAGPLRGDALRAAVAAFLARAADPAAEAALAAWTTSGGALTASPWLDAGGRDEAATTRVWIVEGPKDEVGVLLAAVASFARARGGSVRNGEAAAPPPSGDGKPAALPSTRLVLRVKLQRRQ